jgi:hypothetical protein
LWKIIKLTDRPILLFKNIKGYIKGCILLNLQGVPEEFCDSKPIVSKTIVISAVTNRQSKYNLSNSHLIVGDTE